MKYSLAVAPALGSKVLHSFTVLVSVVKLSSTFRMVRLLSCGAESLLLLLSVAPVEHGGSAGGSAAVVVVLVTSLDCIMSN